MAEQDPQEMNVAEMRAWLGDQPCNCKNIPGLGPHIDGHLLKVCDGTGLRFPALTQECPCTLMSALDTFDAWSYYSFTGPVNETNMTHRIDFINLPVTVWASSFNDAAITALYRACKETGGVNKHNEPQDVAPSLKTRFSDWIDYRTKEGISTYGTPLQTHNGRDAGHDMIEELLDFCQYQEQSRLEALAQIAYLEGLLGDGNY
jgi:hypothetical protein